MKTNKYHLIPKSRGGTLAKDNIRHIDPGKHNKHHDHFGNQTPVEQLIDVFVFNRKVRSAKLRKDLIRVLLNNEGEAYNKNCFKGNPKDDLSAIK